MNNNILDEITGNAETIAKACHMVLSATDPFEKIMRTRKAARDWRLGRLEHSFDIEMPDVPGRPETPELMAANKMPRRKKMRSLKMRIAMLHALAHIEFVAIDLALDMAGRFGALFPREFIDDWMVVAADEALHFALIDRRLKQWGSYYGALPAHDGLWEAAYDTRKDVAARLAIVPMVLEARGLDVTPAMVQRFSDQGDAPTAKILTRIYNDEIRHVGAGTKWFEYRAIAQNHDATDYWKILVKKYFKGALKPPFNDSARQSAGLTRDYYMPLAMS